MATVTVAVLAFAGGCAIGGDSEGSNDRQSPGLVDEPTPSESAAPDAPSSPASPSDRPAASDSEACEEVRLGIDAFNVGEFAETVEHFEKALPLAEEQDDGSAQAGELVEAVSYYAELDAEDYPEASLTSPEFAKSKAITLGQACPVQASRLTSGPGSTASHRDPTDDQGRHEGDEAHRNRFSAG